MKRVDNRVGAFHIFKEREPFRVSFSERENFKFKCFFDQVRVFFIFFFEVIYYVWVVFIESNVFFIATNTVLSTAFKVKKSLITSSS